MNEELFTSHPRSGFPKKVYLFYKKKIISRLIQLLNFLPSDKRKINDIQNILSNISSTEKLSILTFHYFYKLLNVLKTARQDKSLFDQIYKLKPDSYISNDLKIETILEEYWEENCIRELVQDEEEKNRIFHKIDDKELLFNAKHLLNALKYIEKYDSIIFEEVTEYITIIKLFKNNPAIVGGSSHKFFGVIFLNIGFCHGSPLLFYCENIVHEVSHHHLNALNSLDKLVLNSKEERYSSPIRKDSRPMIGVFHATFVLSRMLRFFTIMEREAILNNEVRSELLERIEDFKIRFKSGYDVILKNGCLTQKGFMIFDSFKYILNDINELIP